MREEREREREREREKSENVCEDENLYFIFIPMYMQY